MKCGVTFAYEPSRPHVCGEATPVGGDLARRLVALEHEARARLLKLERRVEELEARFVEDAAADEEAAANAAPSLSGEETAGIEEEIVSAVEAAAELEASSLAPRPRFDRKANHRRYMREWRARQTALRRQAQNV
jgi:hypothetical protein